MKVIDCMKCSYYEVRKLGYQRKVNVYYCLYANRTIYRIEECPLKVN